MRTENEIFRWSLLLLLGFFLDFVQIDKENKNVVFNMSYLSHIHFNVRLYIYINHCAFSQEISIFNANCKLMIKQV